jgi:hypothetical protein
LYTDLKKNYVSACELMFIPIKAAINLIAKKYKQYECPLTEE